MTDSTDFAKVGPGRILIVDDEPLNVDYLEQELESRGFLTDSASNGLDALERVAAAPPDLVLLDVMMRELDGIATLRILKQDPETRMIPVVLMTALNAVEDRVRGIEAGADDFLSKPVDDRELMARIRTAISHKRVIEEAVGELRSTSLYLERYGRHEREVAVLAIEFRLLDETVPDDAVGFVGRRLRDAAASVIGAFGGRVSENSTERSMLVAVFEGPDGPSRSISAIEAAFAVLGDCTAAASDAVPPMTLSAAVAAGPAVVGSFRTARRGDQRWVRGAEGKPIETASALAREAASSAIVVPADVAALVSDRFILESAGSDRFGIPMDAPHNERAAGPLIARRIATILVTDIVGSTRTLEHMGDRAAGEMLAAHERATRAELVVRGGEELNAVGDGFLAAFESPALAIRCAFAVLARVRPLGLSIRAGVHTGELERVEGVDRGIAIHVAVRITAHATPGEVLVSSTTRELAGGAGLRFVDRGVHRLRGVSEPRHLFSAVEPAVGPAPAATALEVAGEPGTAFAAGLTVREVDVLRLVGAGLSDADVAARLYLSVRTVNAHLRAIYRKTGVHSRAAASRFAAEHGLL